MTNPSDPHLRRPLPSFKQWLEEKGGDQRAEGFEEMAALRSLAERTVLHKDAGLPTEQACLLRLWQGMLVAVVELCNIESSHKVPNEMLMAMMPRVLGIAAMYAFASIATDDAPMRTIAKILTEEFRGGCKVAADEIEERR